MWLSAIKLAVSAGSKIYANKQRTKMAMSDAQLMHASRMAEGKEAYQGKLLEARQSDWKDEAVLIIFCGTSGMVYKFMDPCRGQHIWYKGYTNI